MVGKIQGFPSKPSSNQKKQESMTEALFASWVKHEPGKTIHAEDKKRQRALPQKIMVVFVNGKTKWRWSNVE